MTLKQKTKTEPIILNQINNLCYRNRISEPSKIVMEQKLDPTSKANSDNDMAIIHVVRLSPIANITHILPT